MNIAATNDNIEAIRTVADLPTVAWFKNWTHQFRHIRAVANMDKLASVRKCELKLSIALHRYSEAVQFCSPPVGAFHQSPGFFCALFARSGVLK
jgi:hypothetical protein